MTMPFIDLAAQQRRIRDKIDAAIAKVLDSGAYVMGPQVREFEAKLAAFGQAKLALSCANGTDAIALPLMAWDIGPGDAVFCPSFTFAATPEVAPWVGATPVFVDILPDTFNLDPAKLDAAIAGVKAEGKLTPKVVIAVDLFGQPADYPAIKAICDREGLKLIADSAQGFGCTLNGHHPLHWADVATTSFFPAKPLGGYGDGGAVLTNDQTLWDLMDSYRVHGKAVGPDLQGRTFDHDPKYLNTRIGMNSRLDTLQAAILIEKLAIFAEEIDLRQVVAQRYAEGLKGAVIATPTVIDGGVSVWAQYVIEHQNRDGLAAHLKAQGIPTAVYYPVPMHAQAPYAGYPRGAGGLPVTEAKAQTVLALPMHPYLTEADQARIIDAIRAFADRL
ncbi:MULTISPECIES: DegT/DnrJ/EryC1/StrS aminotransferase family protein [Caulobacter]|jgi:dTDP-4-amino-4,6-dideoxygalactose transaminase|uniref:Putative PLP-dependent enzyme possibly involved in cell wall biogenesis n=1 Tax=Caulobacter vibrioides OR37 TaxID=1292034 RepID=R0ENZ4_CAUVI|nr:MULTISPECIES: DegT/DnrJ/EryC1/StrS aminotransferase family protein [Caulobacter]ENZ82757.1 putative PLP-dependent enzyme possibly involved in cell wall biogenesis [Caulobacter vibrioides OR37]MBQ1563253.1 DegT/DnrJ/EryC1/StrS aminotransferase family protein [Caulobacter sp.]